MVRRRRLREGDVILSIDNTEIRAPTSSNRWSASSTKAVRHGARAARRRVNFLIIRPARRATPVPGRSFRDTE